MASGTGCGVAGAGVCAAASTGIAIIASASVSFMLRSVSNRCAAGARRHKGLRRPESIEISFEDAIAPRPTTMFDRDRTARRFVCTAEVAELQRQRSRGFELLEDDARTNAIDAVHFHELVEEESLEIIVRRDDDLQQSKSSPTACRLTSVA
jgi:hypothetical protein